MNIFKSELELINELNKHDEFVVQCANEKLSFLEFCEKYRDFYSYYALDGHESDEEELRLLEKYDNRIKPHRIINNDVLGKVCSDENAKKQFYIDAGRFGSIEAILKLKEISKLYLKESV